MSEPRTIWKYRNRRLYDTTQSRYVTLSEIHKMVTDGIDLMIQDKLSGEDITNSVLLQVITAQEQGEAWLLTREFLLQMIRSQRSGSRNLTARYLDQSLNLFMRQG